MQVGDSAVKVLRKDYSHADLYGEVGKQQRGDEETVK